MEQIVLIVFDLKRTETFEELSYWMEEINKNCFKSEIGLILVWNKNDGNFEERKITKEQGNQLAKSYTKFSWFKSQYFIYEGKYIL